LIFGFWDSLFADPLQDLFSTTGFCVYLGSTIITWFLKKQPLQVDLTAAAEYIAGTMVKEVSWIVSWVENMNKHMNIIFHVPPILFTDTEIIMKLIANREIVKQKLKFIELQQHKIIEHFQSGNFNI
jgi:hypothetical protein